VHHTDFHRVGRAALTGLLALGAAAVSFGTTQAASPPSLAALERAHPALAHTLRCGDRGHFVATLQADLEALGFAAGPVTGFFGWRTSDAVRAFQRHKGLPVTGVANEPTWQDILAAFGLVPPYGASAPTGSGGGGSAHTTGSVQTIDGRPVIAVFHMIATAYGPSLQDNYPYGPVDAFGQPLQPGMVAVDPSVIPLKSYVYVTGYHDPYLPAGGFLGHAMDTGGAIKGDRIDIFMNENPQVVSNFGIQPVTVYLLGS
jgi:3D (Asp-Asp-Asp) domain-containing protein